MTFHDKTEQQVIEMFNSNSHNGLSQLLVDESIKKYGVNTLTKSKEKGFFANLLDALKEPMLLILLFGFVLTLGTNLGKFLKSGEGDFSECFGILFAVILSVSLTLIMEGSSKKAFKALSKIYDNLTVKVMRGGVVVSLPQNQVVVGDIILLESGDKIVADGRLIESVSLKIDESALTGESNSTSKEANQTLSSLTPLAERVNSVYSGTFVTAGNGKMIVTAIGDNTEIGKIASELTKTEVDSPLQQKLGKLGKTITIIGAVTATIVFIVSAIRLYLLGGLTFSSVQELFISSIVLIVAAVPEGLPTIVAISLALNMVKLAKEKALIKKMTATETAGAVSVICSDKTGTLTENKMTVVCICKNQFCTVPEQLSDTVLQQNFVCNSTAHLITKNKEIKYKGSATEGALLVAYNKNKENLSYVDLRNKFKVVDREPFSSQTKFMTTTIDIGNGYRKLIKGAPEVVLSKCNLNQAQIRKIILEIKNHQRQAKRVICFGHYDFTQKPKTESFIYDGFVCITDPIRKEVFKAVADCKRAGIKIKILTGDNFQTAYAVAKQLDIAMSESQVINAQDIDKLDDKNFKKTLSKITVIARSTPIIKLRVVKALKSMNEVVAVTGDGINDAPAIKQADAGIAMGINGSDITKESADIVLLDDSFSTVVKAISFGRNVYKNLQRFILFQLSVNLSALFFITVCAIIGLSQPFNTLQLLWINLIMDGPPALTLGLEGASDDLMSFKPIKRKANIVGVPMLMRIIFNGLLIGIALILEYYFDFLKVGGGQMKGVIFTMFILFQLFNAFNCRELGAKSIFNSIGKNKIMLLTFGAVLFVHFIIVQFCPSIFGIQSLSVISWLKCILVSLSIVIVSELSKFIYRNFKQNLPISSSRLASKVD